MGIYRETYGPYEISMWLMEFLVLALIAYEVVTGILHRRQARKRHLVVLELSRMMDKGQRIQSIVPDPLITTDYQILKKWMDSAEAWATDANTFLTSHSEHAARAFSLITNSGEVDSVVLASGRHFALTGELRERYQRLIVHLENLRRIAETSEAYF
jgi:hypothetical protein